MRRAVTDARDAGANLAFLGANTMYWRIRLTRHRTGPGGRGLPGRRAPRSAVGREAPTRPPPASATLPRRTRSTSCSACSTSATPSTPTTSWSHPGGGGSAAPASAAATRPGPGRSGGRPGLPGPALPRPLQVLSHSPYSCRGSTTTTQSVYYTAGSGAGVFTAGTLRWGCAMIDRVRAPAGRRTQEFTRIGDRHSGDGVRPGPVGAWHPARTTSRSSTCPLSTRSPRAETGQAVRRSSWSPWPRPPVACGLRRARARRRGPAAALAAGAAPRAARRRRAHDPTAESVALRVQTVTGAERLDRADARTEVEAGVGDVLSTTRGRLPRRLPARGLRPGLRAVHQRGRTQATGDIDLLTAARLKDADLVSSPPASTPHLVPGPGGRGARGDGRGALRLRGDDAADGATSVQPPRTLPAPGRDDGTWSIFGYDVTRDDGRATEARRRRRRRRTRAGSTARHAGAGPCWSPRRVSCRPPPCTRRRISLTTVGTAKAVDSGDGIVWVLALGSEARPATT